MCPVCIASTAVMVAGAGSAGGVVSVWFGRHAWLKKQAWFRKTWFRKKEKQDGNR